MEPNPARRCIPTSSAVARPLLLHFRDIWEGPGLSTLPQRAPGASVARLTRNKGGLEIPRNPWRCGTLRRRTIRHAGCAERPTLRGNPAAALGGWKMGCSAPASTSAMCGRCGIHAASNSIRTNLGFMALARGRCHSLLRFSPLFLRMCTPVHINEAKPCPCFKRRALQCILVHASPVHPRKGETNSVVERSTIWRWSSPLLVRCSSSFPPRTTSTRNWYDAHLAVQRSVQSQATQAPLAS